MASKAAHHKQEEKSHNGVGRLQDNVRILDLQSFTSFAKIDTASLLSESEK
jgi:hypothetical protein